MAPAIRANGKDVWIGWPDSPAIEALYRDWFQAPDREKHRAIARELQLQTLRDVTWIPVAQVFLPGFIKFWNVRRG